MEYTKTLPITSRKIIVSKTLVSTATYIPVPLALTGLSLVKPLTTSSTILIPFLIVVAVASASIFEVKLFLSTVAKGKIAAVINDFKKIVFGAFTILIPETAYAASFLTTLDHNLALLSMGGTVLTELAIGVYLLKRS